MGIDSSGALWLVAGGALVAGLASSVHCFAMCGPLACAGCTKAVGRQERLKAMLSWQLSRVLAYGLVGSVLGFVGVHATFGVIASPSWLPWLVALFLVSSALGLGEKLPAIPGSARIMRLAARGAARLSPTVRAGAMGALIPLIPCGVLYGVLFASFASGSWLRGGVLAASFALGGIPSLALAQSQTAWIQRLSPCPALFLRRGLPLLAAAMVVYRAVVVGEVDFTAGVDVSDVSCH